MNSSCPKCGRPVGFWDKFNTSRFKDYVCENCGSKWTCPHHLLGLASAICIPVIGRYFLMQSGIPVPIWMQLIAVIPLLYIIFKFVMPLVPAIDND